MTIFWLAVTFLTGAAYELGCAFWVHYCEAKNKHNQAVVWSMINCLVTCVGLGEALHKPLFVVVYMLGFGTGTKVALAYKDRHMKKEERDDDRAGTRGG